MKICQYLPWYSPAQIGGTEIYILNLSRQLIKAGIEVVILCPAGGSETERFTIDGIPVIASAGIGTVQAHKVDLGVQEPAVAGHFEELMKEIRPDILHFHCFWRRNIFYLEQAAKLGIRTIITPHLASFACLQTGLLMDGKEPCDGIVEFNKCGACLIKTRTSNPILRKFSSAGSLMVHRLNIFPDISSKLARSLDIFNEVGSMIDMCKRVDRSASSIVAISQWYFDVLSANEFFSKDKIRLIATSMPKKSGVRKDRPDTKSLRVAFVGRQSPEKGLHLLLEAVSGLPAGSVEVHLFGKSEKGGIADETDRLIREGFSIYQHHEISNEVLLQELTSMDVLCLPSVSVEMSPLVVHEAMTAGIPVVGADRGGIRDLITDGVNGLLFRYNDAGDLLKKIDLLQRDRGLLGDLKGNCKRPDTEIDSTLSYIDLYYSLLKR